MPRCDHVSTAISCRVSLKIIRILFDCLSSLAMTPKMLHNYPEKRIEKWSKFLLIDFKFNLIYFFSIDDLWQDSWQLVEVLRNTERNLREELSSFLAGSDSSTSQYCEIIQNKLALLQRTWHEYLSEKCPKFSQWNSAPCSSPSLSALYDSEEVNKEKAWNCKFSGELSAS